MIGSVIRMVVRMIKAQILVETSRTGLPPIIAKKFIASITNIFNMKLLPLKLLEKAFVLLYSSLKVNME